MKKEKGRFSTVMDGFSKQWRWYDYDTKKLSEQYYDTEAEARQAAAKKGKDTKVPFNDEEE